MLLEAFDTGWIAPAGPGLAAFEEELSAAVGRAGAVALSSGTAALHLGLVALGIGPGDEVVVPTLTFVATANAVRYVGATPVLVDVDPASWTLDPGLLADVLGDRPTVRAVIPVDLYGRCADHRAIASVCADRGVEVLVDAAEALGATQHGRPAGSEGRAAALSFNGNKIITCGGGGAFVADDPALIDRVRHLATQAREPVTHYEHAEVGYNYRLSNLLAAVGRAQLRGLADKVLRRVEIHAAYRAGLDGTPGLEFMPGDPDGEPNRWLTVVTIDPQAAGVDRWALEAHLGARRIEARPAWKPMHLQPAHEGAPLIGGAVASRIFAQGLCLPSGSGMTDADVDRVIEAVAEGLGV